uniref:Large ribosomal subunit protein uL6c n=1 Tax=Compsopogon caeruleus TaxID=31354 RepID=A0A1Z1XB50_9RHOD|nr:50S ribosomal protein L6 [Compsopogon caeruleus]ARX96090.1 50S ribosomal protein L6 [Compsopogon caeruleus]
MVLVGKYYVIFGNYYRGNMSRIGKKNITIPKEVEVTINSQEIIVKGPKGTLTKNIDQTIALDYYNNSIYVSKKIETKKSNQLYGLTRTIVSNMIDGVSKGFEKSLEIQGVGYRSQIDGKNLLLSLGYSHVVKIEPPEGISISVENNTNINIKGIDKEIVGQIAAKIRSIRSPEPYKGKGVRYKGEYVQRKVGKAGKGK